MKYEAKDYGLEGEDFLFERNAAALWWRMGRGKTVVSATAARNRLDLGLNRRALILAPLRVATKTWPDEFRKWDHLNDVPYQVIRGTAKQRRSQIARNTEVNLINWENLAWLAEEYRHDWPWDLVIADEASKIKSQSSNTHKAMCSVRPKIKTMYNLTGSPAANGLKDVWGHMYVLDRGRRLGRTESAFRRTWFHRDYDGNVRLSGKPAEQEIYDRLGDIVYSLASPDTVEEPLFNPIKFELPDRLWKDYSQLAREAWLELASTETLTAVNAAALTGKLIQFCGGAVYTEHPKWEEVHTKKLDVLKDIMDESEGEPIMVAYSSVHEKERIMRAFPQARLVTEGDHIIDEWNDGKISMLLGHPKSMGHGLNMQFGGCTIVWFSLPWSLELFEQMIARLHGRHGQDSRVIVHMIMAEGTIEEEQWKRLQGKASVQDAVIAALKRILK